jgi:hypothetical protein
MNNPLLRKLTNFTALSTEERGAVADCCHDVREVAAREDVIAQGDAPEALSYCWRDSRAATRRSRTGAGK